MQGICVCVRSCPSPSACGEVLQTPPLLPAVFTGCQRGDFAWGKGDTGWGTNAKEQLGI